MPPALPTVNPFLVLLTLGLLAWVVGAWIWAILRVAFGAPVLPRFEPKLVPWGGKSVLAVLLVWLALQLGVQWLYILAIRGTIARAPGGARALVNPAELMTSSALQNLAVLVVIPLLLGLTAAARPRDFGSLGKKAGWQVLQGMTAWPLAAPVVYGTMLAAVAIWGRESHPLETAIQNDGVGGKAVIFFLAGAVLAPAAEELIFRGVVLGWLTRLILEPRVSQWGHSALIPEGPLPVEPSGSQFPPGDDTSIAPGSVSDVHGAAQQRDFALDVVVDLADPEPDLRGAKPIPVGPEVMSRLALANIAVSVLFGALHFTVWPTPVPIFFLSLALGGLYQRTGSLVAPVTLHMTFNGISTILMFLVTGSLAQVDPVGPPKPTTPIVVPKPVDPITQPPVALLRAESSGSRR